MEFTPSTDMKWVPYAQAQAIREERDKLLLQLRELRERYQNVDIVGKLEDANRLIERLRNALQCVRSAPDIVEAAEIARAALLPESLKRNDVVPCPSCGMAFQPTVNSASLCRECERA